ncbi:hypothetical protein CRUP_023462, partial [Coryphaenoides rupestris]
VFHLEDIVEQTGYVLEKDSEYSQRILEDEEEVNVSVTQKGGKMLQHQEFMLKDCGAGWDLGPDLDHFSSRTRHVLQYMNPNKINQLHDLLSTDKRFRSKDRYRLIVLSTNIAETGVTIPDVVFVIDSGKTKENKYHESSQMSSLVETFVSKASALQRQGRAGRVRNGFCFRLYPKFR